MTKIFQIDLKILSSKLRLFKKILESHFIVLTIFKNLLQFLYAYIHLLSYRVIITYLILTSLRQAIINHLCLKQSMAQVEKPVTSNTETQFLFYRTSAIYWQRASRCTNTQLMWTSSPSWKCCKLPQIPMNKLKFNTLLEHWTAICVVTYTSIAFWNRSKIWK